MSSKRIEKETCGVGSDESGTGGLFGGFSIASFRLTKSNLKILKEQEWYKEIKDPKEMETERIRFIAKQIKSFCVNNKDFYIMDISSKKYNSLLEQHKQEYQILCEFHNAVHIQLENDYTVHMVDNFLYRSGNIKKEYYESILNNKKVEINNFCIKGEKAHTCIALAAILATDSYFEQLDGISKELNVQIEPVKNHKMLPKDIEPILLFLEGEGKNREYIFNNYCKKNKVKEYEKKQKPKKYS